MTQRHLIYLLATLAAVFVIGITAGSFWSNHKIAKLEQLVQTEKQRAANLQITADERGKASEQFKAKTEDLETAIAEIQTIARKQDEKLEKIQANTNAGRDAVRRARSIRSIESTATELCAKLAKLGHGCKE